MVSPLFLLVLGVLCLNEIVAPDVAAGESKGVLTVVRSKLETRIDRLRAGGADGRTAHRIRAGEQAGPE
jgi:hypothetical protein